nr:hypothetical protein [Tanacetum cinerariifolium]
MVIQNYFKLGEDEDVHKELRDSLVRAVTTASSLEAEHDSEMFDVNDLGGKEVFVVEQKVVKDEPEELGKSTTTATIPKQQSHDNGKGIMIEEPVKPKKKDQIRHDKEAAKRLQAEFNEDERHARERELKKNKKPILP